jgi:hypothetical protein
LRHVLSMVLPARLRPISTTPSKTVNSLTYKVNAVFEVLCAISAYLGTCTLANYDAHSGRFLRLQL